MAPPPAPTVILENGGHTIKCGILHPPSSSSALVPGDPEPRIILNACVRPRTSTSTLGTGSRWLIGHEISDALAHDALDYTGMQYRLPFEKGFLTDWDAQKAVWDGLFAVSSSSLGPSTKTGPLLPTGIDTTSATLLVTEPYFNLPTMQDTYDQIVFEEYEFAACWRGVPAALVPHGNIFTENLSAGPPEPKPQCTLIVDAGFSYTHVVPMVDGRVVWQAVKRIDAGGKLLTNILKEQLSFRQWNMMAETFIVQEVKESCCFVAAADGGRRGLKDLLGGGDNLHALDFRECMERCRADPSPNTNPIVQEYVLPDLAAGRKGHVRTRTGASSRDNDNQRDRGREEQVLVMGVERFSVPEVLFRPDDIGLNQSGLAPTIVHSLASLPPPLQPFEGMFWAHVGLVGGCTKFPGFRSRLEAELRALAPVGCEVRVWGGAQAGMSAEDDPITTAYRAAHSFVSSSSSSSSSGSTSTSSYPSFAQETLSRAEYLEIGGGSAAARRRFGAADWQGAPEVNWRARVDEAFGAFGDDGDDSDDMGLDMDVDANRDPRRSSSARTRDGEFRGRQQDEEDMEDAETRAAREKEERRKAARRKRDAERKKRLAEDAALSAAAGSAGTLTATEMGTVTSSKARGGARGKHKQQEAERESASAAGAETGKTMAKAATPAPAAPPRPRVRSTRAGAAEVPDVQVQAQVASIAAEGEVSGSTTADVDTDVQMGGT